MFFFFNVISFLVKGDRMPVQLNIYFLLFGCVALYNGGGNKYNSHVQVRVREQRDIQAMPN